MSRAAATESMWTRFGVACLSASFKASRKNNFLNQMSQDHVGEMIGGTRSVTRIMIQQLRIFNTATTMQRDSPDREHSELGNQASSTSVIRFSLVVV